MLIIYTKSCLACTDKKVWKRVKEYALSKGLQIHERRVGMNTEWAEQAKTIGVELPFIGLNNKFFNLHEPFEELL